jgi:hypothetical protein
MDDRARVSHLTATDAYDAVIRLLVSE